jgi:predicted regulator of Ras-like GTPase activity (Roadblock/LC7/MglB family)
MNDRADSLGFLGVDDVRRFEELLTGFVADSGARCAFLLDRTGRMLSARGDTAGLDETTFASLASAGFAASGQLAQLLGEKQFRSLYHHGAERSMFLADIAGAAVFAVLFDSRTTLGMVRIKTKSLVPAFAEHIAQMAERGPSGQVVTMETGWAIDAESEVDRLFSES